MTRISTTPRNRRIAVSAYPERLAMGFALVVILWFDCYATARPPLAIFVTVGVQPALLHENLPMIGVFGFMLVLGVLLLCRQHKHRRFLENRLHEPFGMFRNAVTRLVDRMEAVSKRHQDLAYSDDNDGLPVTGETLELYQKIDSRLGDVRQICVEMMEKQRQIEEKLDRKGTRKIKDAEDITSTLTVPDTLIAAEQELVDCNEALVALEQAHEQGGKMMQLVREALLAVEENLEKMEASHLSTVPYVMELAAVNDLIAHEQNLLALDPLSAKKVLEGMEERVLALFGWTDRILYHRTGVEELVLKLNNVASFAATTRKEGFTLIEEEGDPDPLLCQGQVEVDAAKMALNRGDDEMAELYLEQAFGWVEKAQQAIDCQVEAKAFCSQRLSELQSQQGTLRSAMLMLHANEGELRRSHHEDAWRSVDHHATRVTEILNACEPFLDQAREQATRERQHYFKGEDILVHVEQQLELAQQLVDAVDMRLAKLQETCSDCERRSALVEEAQRNARDFIQRNNRFVSCTTRELLDTNDDVWSRTKIKMAVEKPHWPMLQKQLNHSIVGFDHCLAQAKDEVESYNRVEDLCQQLKRKEERARDVLRRHHEDTPLAHTLLRDAHQRWIELEQELRRPHNDWEEIHAEWMVVSDQLDQSVQWAVEDLSLAGLAVKAIQKAEMTCQKARLYYRFGVSANLGSTTQGLEKVRKLFVKRNYEEVLQLATSVTAEARQAEQAAVRQTRCRQAVLQQSQMWHAIDPLTDVAGDNCRNTRLVHVTSTRRSRSRAISCRPTFPSRTWHRDSSTLSSRWTRRSKPSLPRGRASSDRAGVFSSTSPLA